MGLFLPKFLVKKIGILVLDITWTFYSIEGVMQVVLKGLDIDNCFS
jgi:hypothetical protein